MSDPKDELGARFGDRKPGEKKPKDDTDKPHNTDNTDNMQTTSDTSDAGSKPGPDRDEDATRHRRQVPMYLSDERAEELNNLYEQLDARSKIAGTVGSRNTGISWPSWSTSPSSTKTTSPSA